MNGKSAAQTGWKTAEKQWLGGGIPKTPVALLCLRCRSRQMSRKQTVSGTASTSPIAPQMSNQMNSETSITAGSTCGIGAHRSEMRGPEPVSYTHLTLPTKA